MSLGVRIMEPKAGRPPWTMERQADMTNHNGVLMMQRLLLAGTLGLAVAQKAAAILDGEPASADPLMPVLPVLDSQQAPDPRNDGAVLRAILDAANECLGHFDDRPPGERWCDALLHLLDLAAFAADLGSAGGETAGPAVSELRKWDGPRKSARRELKQ
jgi:hypothetical protein